MLSGGPARLAKRLWLNRAPTLPALEVPVHPLLVLDVPAIQVMAGACPSLRGLDWLSGRWPANYETPDTHTSRLRGRLWTRGG